MNLPRLALSVLPMGRSSTPAPHCRALVRSDPCLAMAYRPVTFTAAAAAVLSMDAQALQQRVVPVFRCTLPRVLWDIPSHRTGCHRLCGIGHVAVVPVHPLGQCAVSYLWRGAPVRTPIPAVTVLFVATRDVGRSPWSPPPTTYHLSSNHAQRHRSRLRFGVEYTGDPHTQRLAQANPLVHFRSTPHIPGGIHTTPFGICISGACTKPAPHHIADFSRPPLSPCLPSSRP